MIDTIAAMFKVQEVDELVFPAMSLSVNEKTGLIAQRRYLNEDDKPRVTYYPNSGWLRVEWSAQRFGFDEVDEYLARGLSLSLPSVKTWRCQRVDYCVELDVGDVSPYLAAIANLQVGSMTRHPFDDGVVWKAKGRWVKFYDGKKHGHEGKLRFEVSNYKQAVRYMAEHWFGCERTVQEMVEPGRALYVLGRMWEKLGLHQGFASAEREVTALRDAFGTRSLAIAKHALYCIKHYGVESFKSLELMSKSSYYRWNAQLKEKGFLASSDSSLTALHLSCDEIFTQGVNNLRTRSAPPLPISLDKTVQKNLWKNLADVLGVKPCAPRVKYLEERFNGWQSRHNMDSGPRAVQESGSQSHIQGLTLSAVAGAFAG